MSLITLDAADQSPKKCAGIRAPVRCAWNGSVAPKRYSRVDIDCIVQEDCYPFTPIVPDEGGLDQAHTALNNARTFAGGTYTDLNPGSPHTRSMDEATHNPATGSINNGTYLLYLTDPAKIFSDTDPNRLPDPFQPGATTTFGQKNIFPTSPAFFSSEQRTGELRFDDAFKKAREGLDGAALDPAWFANPRQLIPARYTYSLWPHPKDGTADGSLTVSSQQQSPGALITHQDAGGRFAGVGGGRSGAFVRSWIKAYCLLPYDIFFQMQGINGDYGGFQTYQNFYSRQTFGALLPLQIMEIPYDRAGTRIVSGFCIIETDTFALFGQTMEQWIAANDPGGIVI